MIEKLNMFIVLAREQHFGRAAQACGVAQPTLSAAVRSLEDQLGVQLVRRGSRFQGLTAEGEQTLERARRIVADARALQDEMRTARKGMGGVLKLAVIPTALPLAARLTAAMSAAHPAVRFTVLSRTADEIAKAVTNLDIDAGLTYLDGAASARVSAIPMGIERYAVITADAGPLAKARHVKWADLSAVPLALLTPDMQNRQYIDAHLSDSGAQVQPVVESNSIILLLARVQTGDCATILPLDLAETLARNAGLNVAPILDEAAQHSVGLIVPAHSTRTPTLQAFLQIAGRIAS